MPTAPLCLLVDDEPDILELLVMTLIPMGIECCTAGNLHEAKQQLDTQRINLCLTDMKLPDGNGLDLISYIQQHYAHIPVAMITAYGSVESAVQALKAGAFDFISKPVQIKELRQLVNTALQLNDKHEKKSSPLIGNSVPMQELKVKINKLARSQAPIYIKGESGTGKELVARMIHQLGVRAEKPFIPVNCGAIPAELMESEFFGHKKGSFTGANSHKEGLFQAAHGGTLFLDEVADLPLAMQVKLLRAIQEKKVRPVGAAHEEHVDVRILSATHHNLVDLVKKGRFRQDLFYRINVIELFVPPLKQRHGDIPLLINRILIQQCGSTYAPPNLTKEALEALEHYSFPGNVRELENIIERAMTLCENDIIQVDDLQLPEADKVPFIYPTDTHEQHLDTLVDNIEKETIFRALEQTNGNKTKAAKLLGIGFGALRYRLDKIKKDNIK